MWVRSLGWEDPLEEELATTSVVLLGKSQGQRALVGCRPQGCKESHMTEHPCSHAYGLSQGIEYSPIQ